MKLIVLTPEKEFFEGEVQSIKVPGITGQFEILDHHAPIVSALTKGEIRITSSQGDTKFTIERGFIEVLNNEVSVLVQGLEE